WQAPALHARILEAIDADGLVRGESWCAGGAAAVPGHMINRSATPRDPEVREALARSADERPLGAADIVALFQARGPDFDAVCAAADRLRARRVGDVVRYVVNRNVNYTNICFHHCSFCAFSKGDL